MNVSNLTTTGSVTPSVAMKTETGDARKPAVEGNSLPQQARVPEENGQPANANSNMDPAELRSLVNSTNESLLSRFSNLKFTVAEGTNINVVRIEDSETGELIRQIPSEDMIAIARALEEVAQGMVLKEKA